jgi:hypothetical protein
MVTTSMSADDDSKLMNYVVRMIVPMRREFGRALDVRQFLHDFAYAREVMDQALSSQDPRLREYAGYVAQRYHGPRVADSPAGPAPAPAPNAAAAPIAKPAAPAAARSLEQEEAELKARMLKKYTDGLR